MTGTTAYLLSCQTRVLEWNLEQTESLGQDNLGKDGNDAQIKMMIDRFGLLPNQAKNLFLIAQLRNQLSALGVLKIESNNKRFILEFCGNPSIDTGKLIHLIQTNPARYSLVKGTLLQINQPSENIEDRLAQVESLIETLTC